MKTNLLITSLGLIATSVYAQPSVPSVGVPPPTVRAEMPGQGVPSMPQPAMQRPAPQMNQPAMQSPVPQPAVGATGGNGGNGGSGGLLIGNGGTGGAGATPKPSVTMYNGVGPLPANDAKGPTSVGAAGLATPLPRGVGPSPLKNDDVGTNSYVLFTTDIIVTNYNNDVAPPPPLPQSKPLPPSAKQEAQTKAQGLAAKAQAFSEAREKIYYEMSDKEAAKKASAYPDGNARDKSLEYYEITNPPPTQ